MAIKPPVIKAVVNRNSGKRFDVATANPYLITYAMKNRDEFLYIYEDDRVEHESTLEAPIGPPPPIPQDEPAEISVQAGPGEIVEQKPAEAPTQFTEDELKKMKIVELKELAMSYDLVAEGDRTTLIELIMAAQNQG